MKQFSRCPNQSQSTKHRARKLKLQSVYTAVVIVPFVIQIIAAIGLIGWLSVQSGRYAVSQVATELGDEVSYRIRDRLEDYLEVPHRINQLNADAARLGAIDFTDTRSLELRLWRQIQLYDSLSSIGFGSQDGRYIAADRRENTFRLGRRDQNSPEGKLHMYETDDAGNPLRLVYTGKANYDPRTRAWYELGQRSPEGQWTNIFTYSSQPIYVISAVRAIYNETGTFQGVILSDLILSDINDFLKSLDVGQTGETFILERSGALIATSTDASPYRIVNGNAQRIQAIEIDSPLIQASAQYLLQRFGSFAPIQETERMEFNLNGQRQFIQVLPYADARGLDWLIVVVVPEPDFTAPIHANQRLTVGVGLLAMLVVIGVGAIVARWLVRPITGLAAAATALADGDSDESLFIERDDEIGILADAFQRIAGRLQHSLEALKARESNLAEAQRIARLGSWEYDLSKQQLICSDELFRLYGLEPGTDSLEQLMNYQRIHPDDRNQVQETIAHTIATMIPFEIDHRILHSSGQMRYVHSKGHPIVNEAGQVIGMFGTQMDITERKAAEAERKQLLEREKAARQDAEAANQAKDQFLAILSHELRTPLNSILGWTQLLRTRKLDAARSTQALEIIERNAKLQAQLIEDLLDVSKILRGKLKLELRPVKLVDVILVAIETIQLNATKKSIQIHTDFASPDLQVQGDPNRLQQVIWNLLANAVKFTPRGGRIDISLTAVNQYATIQIRDTGKGIEPEFLPHIFDHFQQADSTTTREFGGLGLGLAIVRYLTHLHGGTISASSPGTDLGATFTLQLPLIPFVPSPD